MIDPIGDVLREEFSDLHGVINVHASLGLMFPTDFPEKEPPDAWPTVLLVEHRLSPVVKHACWIPVSSEALQDAEMFRSVIAGRADRHLRPWKYADRTGWPERFSLFPRVERLAAALRHHFRSRDEGWGDDDLD